MRRMGIRELRDTLTKTIREVRAGESIEITHDGEPIALLSPVVKDRIDWLIAAGLVNGSLAAARVAQAEISTKSQGAHDGE